MIRSITRLGRAGCTALALAAAAACTGTLGTAPVRPAADPAAINAAIENPQRPASDVSRDGYRKPRELLEFAGVRPGQSVLDFFAGGGYLTELAYYAVGPGGKVTAYNNTAYERISAKESAARYGGGRLPGVQQIVSENNATTLPAQTYDVALFVMAYHDVYYLDGERGWERIDTGELLRELYSAMKPGGTVLVVDHIAPPDLPREQVRALHRIDPALIKSDFSAAGFMLDGEADFLRNPADQQTVMAMAPPVRNQTDRAVLRFVRPLSPK
jgi:predicted methyltransferase